MGKESKDHLTAPKEKQRDKSLHIKAYENIYAELDKD
jgi:hypothetical protein